jgi:hypothetical protein
LPYLFRRFRQSCAVLEKRRSSSIPDIPRDGEGRDQGARGLQKGQAAT